MTWIKLLDKIPGFFRNKYVLTVLVFLIWLILMDSNNLVTRYKNMRELSKLRREKEYYMDKIKTDKEKLYLLKTDDQNLEKFAREQYRMKEPDEDLYIVLTPREDRKISRKNK